MAFLTTTFRWPTPSPFSLEASGGYSDALNTGNVQYAWCFQVPKTGTLKGVEFDIESVTSSQDIKVSFQDLTNSSFGQPDEVADQYRVITPGVGWNTTGIMSSDGTDDGTKRSVTIGDFLAVVIEWDSTQGDLEINQNGMSGWSGASGTQKFPYMVRKDAGGWDAGAGAFRYPRFALQYDDGSYGYIPFVWPLDAATSISVNTGTTPDEVGLLFSLPFTAKVGGVWAMASATQNFDFVLYNADSGSVVQTYPWDLDLRSAAAGHFGGSNTLHVQVGDQVTLTADTLYRLVIKPTTGSTVTTAQHQLASADLRACYGEPSNWSYTSRTDAGAWTDDDTILPHIGIIIEAINIEEQTEAAELFWFPPVVDTAGWGY
jgi:hypothetical protein